MLKLKLLYRYCLNKKNILSINNLKIIFFNKIYNKVKEINHNGYTLYFHIPNKITLFRANSFSEKEPETLEWIDKFESNSIFWDIGANVGLYSIYATKVKNTQTYAFEPSVFNLEFLAKNIYLNKLYNKINILPIALSDTNSINTFNMSNIDWGGALSTFSKSYDQFGNDLKINFKYNTIGMSSNFIVKYLNIPKPKYIKIDVDGIEHLILNGMSEILNHTSEILIELNDSFKEQIDKSQSILIENGFVLQNKYIDKYNKNGSANQIWKK
jgi:FkbM family methyltransferase